MFKKKLFKTQMNMTTENKINYDGVENTLEDTVENADEFTLYEKWQRWYEFNSEKVHLAGYVMLGSVIMGAGGVYLYKYFTKE